MANHKKLKKVVSKSDRESRKKKKNGRIVAIVMAILMIASLAGIALSGLSPTTSNGAFTYGDYSFELKPIDGSLQSLLVTEVNGEEVGFYSLPQDTLQLDVSGNLSFLQSTEYMVLTGNPDDTLMTIQDILRFEMSQASGKSIGGAVMFESENYSAYPVVNCENASVVVPVIEIVESNKTKIVVEGSCVKIQSQPQDILYVRDRLLYQILGILN
jgi:hypothetical protein